MIKKLFINSTDNVLVQFFRYIFVGGLAFLVDFGVFTFLTTFFAFFMAYYIWANIISFVLGLTANYFFSVRWVFNNRNVRNKLFEFVLFAGVGLIGLVLNSFFIWLFKEHILAGISITPDKIEFGRKVLDVKIVISKLIATVLVYLWNFFARKLTLFK